MLSYNWDSQEIVKEVYDYLIQNKISVWMDIKGGMKVDMMKSISSGVQGATVIVCFCTQNYQNSQSCETELKYAYDLQKLILPVICDDNYTKRELHRSVGIYKW